MVPLSTAHLFVRWLHVLAMAVILGGGALAWGVSRTADARTTLAVASPYEAAFWSGVGVLVMTGVGNLGALAPAIPRGQWGVAFVAKLGLLVALFVGSAVRTAMVQAMGHVDDPAVTTLERGYALTVIGLTAIVGLAEVLAHG